MAKELVVELLYSLVGMSEEEATKKCDAAEVVWRVAARDDEELMTTFDFNSERINLHIVSGKVNKATTG